jgi:thiosulfate reductase cytochrome b subunit
MKKIYIYQRFERFWHWTQALLILFLALTGFEVHSAYKLFGFKTAVFLHINTAIFYVILYLLIISWIFFSGFWRQLVPKKDHIIEQINYYLNGIFKGEEHPTVKSAADKFNDLQRLTYFTIVFIIIPIMIITGLTYMNYNYVNNTLGLHIDLRWIAYTHVFFAFFLVAFVIGHIYLTTTGYKPLSAIKAMLTGWEEMSDEEAEKSLREYLNYTLYQIKHSIVNSKDEKDSQTFNSVFNEVAETLQISSDELQKRLVRANIGYFKLDADGKYIEVNEVWKKLYECTNIDNPIGKDFILDATEKDKENMEYILNKVLKGETLTGMKVVRYCKDGTKRYHTISITPIKEDGKVVALEGYIIDLPEENDK